LPCGLHPVRRDLRRQRLALRAAGAGRVGADAGRALAVPLGLYPAGRELRRRDELRDVSDVLLLLRALSAVEIAGGRIGAALSRRQRNPVPLRSGADPLRALRHVRAGRRGGGRRLDRAVLPAGGDRLRSATRHVPPRRAAGVTLCWSMIFSENRYPLFG